MHGQRNIKLCDAKQVYHYKNIKLKLYKNNAAIWFNKTCKAKHLTPTYTSIKIIFDHSPFTEWRCHMLLTYNCILLKMSTWYSKHVENIWWINNIKCITLVFLVWSIHDARSVKKELFSLRIKHNKRDIEIITNISGNLQWF